MFLQAFSIQFSLIKIDTVIVRQTCWLTLNPEACDDFKCQSVCADLIIYDCYSALSHQPESSCLTEIFFKS